MSAPMPTMMIKNSAMTLEQEIAARCLCGIIINQKPDERARCIQAIQRAYGHEVARYVMDLTSRL